LRIQAFDPSAAPVPRDAYSIMSVLGVVVL
jgi:hypothetical protein